LYKRSIRSVGTGFTIPPEVRLPIWKGISTGDGRAEGEPDPRYRFEPLRLQLSVLRRLLQDSA